ncbi:MAG: 30S ribosomal protein S13 [Candidatus Marsarchaeota archaeon]|nr:30S ribosomal protein S13 [Candidatus Marsarchaeota archaeon]MCL5095084.1 30S ribosomal protein S13 [Candidatus Marsarchaeota archaeon]
MADKIQRKKENISSIIRIAGKDINGSLNIERSLQGIKGIGANMAKILSNTIEKELNINKSATIGSLSEDQIENIENILKTPLKYNIPKFLLNRRKNNETGEDSHVIGNDLIFASRQDINRYVTLKTWRGFRHQYGLKVRGQSTRSTGRTGTSIGVVKKALKPGAGQKEQDKTKAKK